MKRLPFQPEDRQPDMRLHDPRKLRADPAASWPLGSARATLAIAKVLMVVFAMLGSSSVVSQATDIPVRGGPGGGYFRTDCSGDYAVGVYLRTGAWVDAIGLKCAKYDHQGRFIEPAWSKPSFGGTGGGLQEQTCPTNMYISAVAAGFTRRDTQPEYADYIELTCTDIAGRAPPKKLCLHTGELCWQDHPNIPASVRRYLIASAQVGLLSKMVFSCPPNEALIGLHGRSGKYLDAIGAICGERPKLAKRLGKARTPPPPVQGTPLPDVTPKSDGTLLDAPGGKQVGRLLKSRRYGLIEYRDGWCHVQNWDRQPEEPLSGWVAQSYVTGCPR